MRKTAAKLANRIKKLKNRKKVDLFEFKKAKAAAEEARKTIHSAENLMDEGNNATFAVYAEAQNVISVLAEILLELDECDRYHKIMSDAQDQYMPGGPPMSPITNSFFYSWALFDLAVGIHKETLTTITLDIASIIGVQKGLQELLQVFDTSYNGFYKHLGFDNGVIILRDIHTGKLHKVINPTGFEGSKGELWYVRLLPAFLPQDDSWVCFTTPYRLTTAEEDWSSFFDRGIWLGGKKPLSFEKFLKYGLNNRYWLEFVMQSYSGNNAAVTVIDLYGVPDIGATRPHDSQEHCLLLPEASQEAFV